MSSVGPEKSACPGPVVRSRQDGTKNQKGGTGGRNEENSPGFFVRYACCGFRIPGAIGRCVFDCYNLCGLSHIRKFKFYIPSGTPEPRASE